jgi:hypothetical protein
MPVSVANPEPRWQRNARPNVRWELFLINFLAGKNYVTGIPLR